MPNITITEEEFAQFINGQSVERDGIGILLGDFGYDRMLVAIDAAIDRRHGGNSSEDTTTCPSAD